MIQLTIIDSVIHLDTALKNRLVFSLFSLLIFILLAYCWNTSRSKMKVTNKDGSGLIYLSIAFLLYFVLGFMSVFDLNKELSITGSERTLKEVIRSFDTPLSYYIISGLISLSFLSSLSFFAIKRHKIDRIVSDPSWKNGIKYIAFFWIIIITINQKNEVLIGGIDVFISILSFVLLGFFISKYFIQRNLKFLGLISGLFFIVIILLQVIQPFKGLTEEKFIQMNTYFLAPAMALSVIILSYAFNWMNELSFHELSKVWVDENVPTNKIESELNVSPSKNRETWKEKIARDEIEKVIEEIIILKKYRNENLEHILNIASRNTRNNNNHMKNIIKYEDYQLNRNQISHSLISLLTN